MIKELSWLIIIGMMVAVMMVDNYFMVNRALCQFKFARECYKWEIELVINHPTV